MIGGLAVSARVEPRFTRDVDLAVAVHSDRDAENLIRAMFGRGFQMHMQLEQKSVGRLATCRLVHKDDPHSIIVDLFFASSGIEQDVINAATVESLADGVELPIAQPEDLIVLKLLAVANRNLARDTEDVLKLLNVVDERRLERTRTLLKIVAERRPESGGNLRQLFQRLLAESRGQS